MAIVAHHRITTFPRKGATKKAGMNVHEAAAHFAQKEAIEKMKAKRAAAKGAENV